MKHKKILLLIILLLVGCQNNQTDPIPPQERKADGFKKEMLEKPLYFLVLGIDSRGEEKSRTDSILIFQYTAKEKTLKIVSIMRDTFVRIDGYKNNYGKINMAYFLGGEALLKKTIKNTFHIPVDYTVTIDFKGFAKVIDTLVPEGVTVTINQAIIDDMKLNVAAGENKLHGEELLKYVRFRHDAKSDFGRVGRQQEVVKEVINEVTTHLNTMVGIGKIPVLVDESIKNVKTDLSVSQILTLSSSLFLQPIEKIETLSIPVSKGFVNKNDPNEGAVLDINIPMHRTTLSNFFKYSTPVNH